MIVALSEAPSLADLLEELGGISPSRIRVRPPLGTATEQDVINIHDRENRLFELVDGVLVEKVMGYYEGRSAAVLIFFLETFLTDHNLGITAGADAMMRLSSGLIRIPDVSFISWDRLPGRRVPRMPIPQLAPNLAVELLSEGNTRAEMDRKLREYFAAGIELVWYIDPDTHTAQVWTSLEDSVAIEEDGALDGGTVLPGFRLPLRDFFARVDAGLQQGGNAQQ
jgi:Uma2 family endonuclease